MTDEFFDDEQELMEASTPKAKAAAGEGPAPAAETAGANPPVRRDAPPFWMVLAIAAIALVLGVVIGYLLGTSATLSQLENMDQQPAMEQPQGVSAADDVSEALPDGHPQLSVDEAGNATVADSGSSAAQD